jgi:transposase
MSYNFKPCDRSQMLLLPPSLDEWLPEEHLARFIVDAVGQFDLSEFMAEYRHDGTGQAAFHPAPVLALLLYWYCKGERSSRKIESYCADDVASRYIMANQQPDHSMFCRFRVWHQSALAKVFVQVLRLCEKAGLVKLGSVSLDGTKLKASAALSANRKLDALEAEVQKMLSEANAEDEREDDLYGKDKRGDELPPGLRTSKERKQRLQECVARLKAEQEAARAAQQGKLDARKEEESASGKHKRGRKPKQPDEAVDKEQKANTTDPESRIMKTRSGYVQGYNAQAVVTEAQIIVAADVTNEENDQLQLKPMLKQAQANLKAVGLVAEIVAVLTDAGYCSEANLKAEAELGVDLYCATTKDWKQRQALREAPVPRGRVPKHLSIKDRMERKLLTMEGRAMYKKRGQTVEPVFGQVKTVQDGGRCMRRGLEANRSEWRFTCSAHNLLKLWRSSRRPGK